MKNAKPSDGMTTKDKNGKPTNSQLHYEASEIPETPESREDQIDLLTQFGLTREQAEAVS